MVLSGELFEGVVGVLNPMRAGSANASGSTEDQRQSPRIPLATRLTLVPFADRAQMFGGYDFPAGPDGLIDMPLGDPVSTPVRDLSRGGVRFMMPRRLPLDTPFLLLLPRPQPAPPPRPSLVNAGTLLSTAWPAAALRPVATTPTESPVVLECAVTYWQPVQKGLFGVGARFVRQLDNVRLPSTPPTLLLPGFGNFMSDLSQLRKAV